MQAGHECRSPYWSYQSSLHSWSRVQRKGFAPELQTIFRRAYGRECPDISEIRKVPLEARDVSTRTSAVQRPVLESNLRRIAAFLRWSGRSPRNAVRFPDGLREP